MNVYERIKTRLQKRAYTRKVWCKFLNSKSHMFYQYDLTINLWALRLIVMWKATENGKKHRENYGSFNMYWKHSLVKRLWF
jgi:hypothetical protein